MRRDINICRIRRENNLPCCNCVCDECPEKKKPKEKQRKKMHYINLDHDRRRWTKEEDKIAADLTLSAGEVSERTGRSLMAVCKYRTKHKYYKIIREGRKDEDLHQRSDQRDEGLQGEI